MSLISGSNTNLNHMESVVSSLSGSNHIYQAAHSRIILMRLLAGQDDGSFPSMKQNVKLFILEEGIRSLHTPMARGVKAEKSSQSGRKRTYRYSLIQAYLFVSILQMMLRKPIVGEESLDL